MTQGSAKRWRSAAWTMLALFLLPVLIYVVVVVATPATGPAGECSGFGCAASSRDWLVYYGVFFGAPVLVGAVLLGSAVCAVLLVWTRWSGVGAAITGVCSGLLGAGAAAALYFAVLSS